MKVRSILLITSLVFICISCTTTGKTINQSENTEDVGNEDELIEETEEDLQEYLETAVESSEEIIEKEEEIVEISPEEAFIEYLQNINISEFEAPKQIVKRKKFEGKFSVKVTDSTGSAVCDFPVNAVYPARKENGLIIYETESLITDENGICSVSISNTDFAANDFISFAPQTDFDAENVVEAVKSKQVDIPFKIKSDVLNKGAVLFVWDFSERNKPVNNSYEILSEFRNRGMTLVGNAPINDTSYIDKPLSTVYKANYEIIEDSYGYLVCGTIKFAKPVEACDDGYLCSLVAEISAVNMKNGDVVFNSTFSNETIGANWNKATGKCKDELAKHIVDALVYGL